MSNYKFLIISLFIVSTIYGQELINAYGIGFRNNTSDASTLSLSSSGIIPSFRDDVGLQNPSTWHNLNYTYFSGSYQGNYIEISNSVDFGNALFNSIQFVVPIKNKYSFGLGLSPYSNQYVELQSEESEEFIAFDDTLDTYSSFCSYGGINELSISIGANVVEHLNLALKFGFLYGSNRQEDIFTLDALDYYSQDRYLYSGSIGKVFINSSILTKFNIPINIYTGYGFPIKSINAEAAYYQPFEDSDDSGFQDSSDFPSSSEAKDPSVETIVKLSSPYEYQLGLEYQISDELSLLGEVYYWNDESEISNQISQLNDQIKSVYKYNIGIARFGSTIIKKPLDRFNIKLSAYSQNVELLVEEKMIKEYGVSTGLSFNFGIAKNQIDLAYSFGRKQGLNGIGDESVHKYSIGISLGDIWFIKRRSR